MITKQTWKIGDANKLLHTFDDFHLCVTSPPYNVQLYYGVYKDDLPTEEYINFLTDLFVRISTKLAAGCEINPAYEKIIEYKSMGNIPSLENWL